MTLVSFSKRRPSRGSPLDELLGDVSVLERLDDLRSRLVKSAVAVMVGILLGFAFIGQVVDFILAPARAALPEGARLIYTEPAEAFGLYIQISMVVGIAIAMPYIMYQLWKFIEPFVPKGTRRFTIPFVVFTTTGFIGGSAFTHFIAFRYMMVFFASFNTPDLQFMPKLDYVFSLYTTMLLGMGVVFQMPTVVYFLAKAGLVSAGLLWKSFRYALLLIFVVAAVITPTGDMVTQAIFAAPMLGLYLLSIMIAWMFGPGRVRDDAEADADAD